MQRIDVALIRSKVREQGLWKVIRRIVAELGRLVYHQRSCYIFRDDLDRPFPLNPVLLFEQLAGFEFRWLDLARGEDRGVMADMMGRAEFGYTPEDLQQRLDRHDRCYVALDEGKAATYVWQGVGEREIYTGQRMWPGAGECFLYDGYTFKEYRGRRLLPGIMCRARKDLAAEGFRRILADIACDNTSSIRAVEAAGFYRHARITGHIFFGLLRCYRWKILAETGEPSVPPGAGK